MSGADGFQPYIMRYLEYCESHAQSPRTIANKSRMLGYFVDWCISEGLPDVQRVRLQDFERYSLYLCRYRKYFDNKPLAVSTRRLWLTAVREWFRRLYYLGVLDEHPLVNFELPRVPRSLPQAVLTLEDIQVVLEQVPIYGAKALRDKALLETLFATGIRTAELARLNLADVETARRLLTISKGKGRKDRRVPFAQRTQDAIDQYLAQARPKLAGFEVSDALFLNNRGKRYRPEQLSRLVSAYINQSGISS